MKLFSLAKLSESILIVVIIGKALIIVKKVNYPSYTGAKKRRCCFPLE